MKCAPLQKNTDLCLSPNQTIYLPGELTYQPYQPTYLPTYLPSYYLLRPANPKESAYHTLPARA